MSQFVEHASRLSLIKLESYIKKKKTSASFLLQSPSNKKITTVLMFAVVIFTLYMLYVQQADVYCLINQTLSKQICSNIARSLQITAFPFLACLGKLKSFSAAKAASLLSIHPRIVTQYKNVFAILLTNNRSTLYSLGSESLMNVFVFREIDFSGLWAGNVLSMIRKGLQAPHFILNFKFLVPTDSEKAKLYVRKFCLGFQSS